MPHHRIAAAGQTPQQHGMSVPSSVPLSRSRRPNTWTRPPGSFSSMAAPNQLLLTKLATQLKPMRRDTVHLVRTLAHAVITPHQLAEASDAVDATPVHQQSFLSGLSDHADRYQGPHWFATLQADYQQHLGHQGRTLASEGEWVGMEAALAASRASFARGQRVQSARSVIGWSKARNQWNRQIKTFLKNSLANPIDQLGEQPGVHWLLNASEALRSVSTLHRELVAIKDELKTYTGLHRALRDESQSLEPGEVSQPLETVQDRLKARVIRYHRMEARLFRFLDARLGLFPPKPPSHAQLSSPDRGGLRG